jgi:septal ring factor EnvC (AmiA/AmiB activator)
VHQAENQKQEELVQMRKLCASVSRKISARKNEAASLKRHLAMIDKDNQELQADVMELETLLFPQVFKHPKI